MNVLILEDNKRTREVLERIVHSCEGVQNVYGCGSREEAFMAAMDNSIDLFLLDIVLEPGKANDNSGILFAENMRRYNDYKLTPIIFITVLEGLERELLKKIHCYDYIEKPIGDGRILKSHIQEALESIETGKKPEARESVPLHYDGIGYMVFPDEVMYFESSHGRLSIHLVDDEIVIPNLSAKKFMAMIQRSRFLSPVYGTFVNVEYIASVDFRNREVYMKDDHVIPIGGRKLRQFREEYLT